MKVYEQDNTVILEDIKDFNPKHIFECGQCFRWIKEDDESYTGVAKGRVINVSKQGDKVFLKNTNLDDFNNIWFEYFDLGTDYGKIKDILRSDADNGKISRRAVDCLMRNYDTIIKNYEKEKANTVGLYLMIKQKYDEIIPGFRALGNN